MSNQTPPPLPPQQSPYTQQAPLPQQQVIVQSGYTFGKFCLHFVLFVGLSIVLIIGGCSALLGGCSAVMQDAYNDMSEHDKKQLRQRMEERGHNKNDLNHFLGTSE